MWARKIVSIRQFLKYLKTKAHLIDNNIAEELETPKLPKRIPKYISLEVSLRLLIQYEKSARDFVGRITTRWSLFLFQYPKKDECRTRDIRPTNNKSAHTSQIMAVDVCAHVYPIYYFDLPIMSLYVRTSSC